MELNRTKMGVLSDNYILMHNYRESTEERIQHIDATEIFTLGQLLEGAHYFDIDTLWIAPGSWVSHASRTLLQKAGDEFQIYSSKRTDLAPRFLLVYRKSGNTKSVKFAFPEWDERWPWQYADAETLFRSILYLQDALQHEIAWSPGHTGQDLIQACDKHEWIKPITFPDVLKRTLPVDMRWKRPLKPEEKPGMYLHLFDGNAKYVAACTGVNIGEGDPKYFESHGGDIQFNPRYPGAWWIPEWGWLWTPELEYKFACLQDENKPRPAILCAWLWTVNDDGKPRYHESLKAWGYHLWYARQELKAVHEHEEAARLAYEAFKLIYTQGLGWFAHPQQGEKALYRPDIWAAVVAGCKRSMGFKIRQLAKVGFDVCYVDVDTLGIVSDSESVEPFRRNLLSRETEPGGFKYQGCISLSPELIEAFSKPYKQDVTHKAIKSAMKEARG